MSRRWSHGLSSNDGMYRRLLYARGVCKNKSHPQYRLYGGRGIKFLWDTMGDAVMDMKPSYFTDAVLRRIDEDDHFYKENCVWKPALRVIEVNNEKLSIKDAINKYGADSGVYEHLFRARLALGWDAEEAIKTPVGSGYSRRKKHD